MHDALVGVVVGVGEQDVPVWRQSLRVDREAVVLARDEAAVRSFVDTRLVVASVSVSETEQNQSVNISLETF